MLKKTMLFALLGSMMIGTISVSAAQTIEIDIEKDKVSVQKDETIDYEKEYAYDGKDYTYAKISYLGKEYAVPRSEYWKVLQMLDVYGITEENYASFVKVEVVKSEPSKQEKKTQEAVPPVKDTRTPWNEWSDEMWNSYTAYAQSFEPDEWQKSLLEYYSLTEIYAYYMGGYTIDEGAYRAYLDAKANGTSNVVTEDDSEDEEVTENVSQYNKLYVTANLFSLYDNEKVYYVDTCNSKDVKTTLSEFEYFNEETVDTKNPNAFVEGEYYFEIGTADDHVTEYLNVKESDAKQAVQFVNKNKIKDTDQLSKKEWDSIYKVRICTLRKNGSEYDKTCELKYEDAMTLISTYLKSNTKVKGSQLVQVNEPIYNG